MLSKVNQEQGVGEAGTGQAGDVQITRDSHVGSPDYSFAQKILNIRYERNGKKICHLHAHAYNTFVLSRFRCVQFCATLQTVCSPPGSSVHGILQAGILEWVAMPSSTVSSQPKDRTCVPCVSYIGRQDFYH